LLEGKLVNLKVLEKDDLPLLADWSNNPEFFGEFGFDFFVYPQMSKVEWEKRYDSLTPDTKWFFIEKKTARKSEPSYTF
jgi:hypothetical protein